MTTTAPGSLREAQKALTRARIIEAARPVFEREGYSGASIGLITDEAAINRATFYLHFPDKAEVFREVIAHDRTHLQKYWRELNAALVTGTPEAIVTWVQYLTQWYRDNARLMPSKHEAMASDAEFAKQFQPRYDHLAAEISDYLDQFPPHERESQKIKVQMLIVMADQILFHSIVQEVWEGPQTQVLQVIAEIMCSALGFTD